MKQSDTFILLTQFNVGGTRPAATPHAALPPFDPNDSGGIVHTTLPPEQFIPAHFADPTFMRADFNGVTLDTNRWGGNPPFLPGANSTPLAMLMTPMLVLYPRHWQDACLTEHAERGYDDLIVDCEPWNGPAYSPADMLAWCRYVQSWGFRVVLWRGDPTRGIDPMLDTLMQAGAVNFYVHGEEVDRKVTAEQYAASLNQIDQYVGGRIPIGVHFTCDGDRKMGYPLGFPRDTFLNDWSPYDGRVHLCLQLEGESAPAGLQGAAMYYARQHVNAGIGDAARGPGAPNSRVIAFETMATKQLYGRCDEAYGCLRSWELLCGTRLDSRVRPVSGSGNGIRYPNGDPL